MVRAEPELTLRYEFPINQFAFSNNGRHIAVIEHNGRLSIRDLSTDETIAAKTVSWWGDAMALAFSSDDTRLVWGSKSLQIVDENLVTVWKLKGNTDYVTAVSFSPDGRYVASAAVNDRVLVWDAGSGTLLFKLKHEWEPKGAFFLGEEMLVSVEDRGMVRWWDLTTGEQTMERQWWTPPGDELHCVGLATNGTLVGGCSTNVLWDAKSGDVKREIPIGSVGTAIDTEGTRLAVSRDDWVGIDFYDLENDCVISTIKGGTTSRLSFSNDGNRFGFLTCPEEETESLSRTIAVHSIV